MTGLFIAVVGASGVGKDALLEHARAHLDQDERFFFPRRVITRPENLGGESFDGVEAATFRQMAAEGCFALAWEAHGLSYGLRREASDALRAGRCVVANVSRAALRQAAAKFGAVHVIQVTAPAEVVVKRLLARGREPEGALASRYARFNEVIPPELTVSRIDNGGELQAARAKFIDLLLRLADRRHGQNAPVGPGNMLAAQ